MPKANAARAQRRMRQEAGAASVQMTKNPADSSAQRQQQLSGTPPAGLCRFEGATRPFAHNSVIARLYRKLPRRRAAASACSQPAAADYSSFASHRPASSRAESRQPKAPRFHSACHASSPKFHATVIQILHRHPKRRPCLASKGKRHDGTASFDSSTQHCACTASRRISA